MAVDCPVVKKPSMASITSSCLIPLSWRCLHFYNNGLSRVGQRPECGDFDPVMSEQHKTGGYSVAAPHIKPFTSINKLNNLLVALSIDQRGWLSSRMVKSESLAFVDQQDSAREPVISDRHRTVPLFDLDHELLRVSISE
jgi:hypothetical protein